MGRLDPERCLPPPANPGPPRSHRVRVSELLPSRFCDAANKYSLFHGPAEIRVESTGDEREVAFIIRDNDAGFDVQYTDKLFGVSKLLHDAEEFEEKGIGLAGVRRIVGRNAGRAWAGGCSRKGATFYFSLPRFTENSDG